MESNGEGRKRTMTLRAPLQTSLAQKETFSALIRASSSSLGRPYTAPIRSSSLSSSFCSLSCSLRPIFSPRSSSVCRMSTTPVAEKEAQMVDDVAMDAVQKRLMFEDEWVLCSIIYLSVDYDVKAFLRSWLKSLKFFYL